jgi:hypothetical protein
VPYPELSSSRITATRVIGCLESRYFGSNLFSPTAVKENQLSTEHEVSHDEYLTAQLLRVQEKSRLQNYIIPGFQLVGISGTRVDEQPKE